jgi:hypothetical protein
MILVILLLVPALDLIFNNNGLDDMLYAKRKACGALVFANGTISQ